MHNKGEAIFAKLVPSARPSDHAHAAWDFRTRKGPAEVKYSFEKRVYGKFKGDYLWTKISRQQLENCPKVYQALSVYDSKVLYTS
jgi:hypothetical protein